MEVYTHQIVHDMHNDSEIGLNLRGIQKSQVGNTPVGSKDRIARDSASSGSRPDAIGDLTGDIMDAWQHSMDCDGNVECSEQDSTEYSLEMSGDIVYADVESSDSVLDCNDGSARRSMTPYEIQREASRVMVVKPVVRTAAMKATGSLQSRKKAFSNQGGQSDLQRMAASRTSFRKTSGVKKEKSKHTIACEQPSYNSLNSAPGAIDSTESPVPMDADQGSMTFGSDIDWSQSSLLYDGIADYSEKVDLTDSTADMTGDIDAIDTAGKVRYANIDSEDFSRRSMTPYEIQKEVARVRSVKPVVRTASMKAAGSLQNRKKVFVSQGQSDVIRLASPRKSIRKVADISSANEDTCEQPSCNALCSSLIAPDRSSQPPYVSDDSQPPIVDSAPIRSTIANRIKAQMPQSSTLDDVAAVSYSEGMDSSDSTFSADEEKLNDDGRGRVKYVIIRDKDDVRRSMTPYEIQREVSRVRAVKPVVRTASMKAAGSLESRKKAFAHAGQSDLARLAVARKSERKPSLGDRHERAEGNFICEQSPVEDSRGCVRDQQSVNDCGRQVVQISDDSQSSAVDATQEQEPMTDSNEADEPQSSMVCNAIVDYSEEDYSDSTAHTNGDNLISMCASTRVKHAVIDCKDFFRRSMTPYEIQREVSRVRAVKPIVRTASMKAGSSLQSRKKAFAHEGQSDLARVATSSKSVRKVSGVSRKVADDTCSLSATSTDSHVSLVEQVQDETDPSAIHASRDNAPLNNGYDDGSQSSMLCDVTIDYSDHEEQDCSDSTGEVNGDGIDMDSCTRAIYSTIKCEDFYRRSMTPYEIQREVSRARAAKPVARTASMKAAGSLESRKKAFAHEGNSDLIRMVSSRKSACN